MFIILALLTTISGCRALSDMLDPDKNAQVKNLPAVKREKPNLSFETAEIDVDPDSDALTEESGFKPDSVGDNSNVASVTDENSSVTTEQNTDEDNTNAEQDGEQDSEMSAGNNIVTFNSFGKVKIGMTISQASQALGTELVRGAGYEDSCYYVAPKQSFNGVRFMVTQGAIARVDIESKAYATDKGAKIGDTEAKIKSLYKGIEVYPNKYDEKKNDMEVYSVDKQFLIIFETDGKRITGFRAGKAEETGYVEGCS